MILTAHQPVYLPWLGLFHKIALADEFVFFDNVQYTTKDYVSRNLIKGNSSSILLTVPVFSKNHFDKKINEIEINNTEKWQKKHWKSIYLNYKNAPYFNKYADFLEDIYNKDWKYLADLNHTMLLWHLKVLGINVKVVKMSDYNFEGEKSGLVLNMCKQLNADKYIFGKLGQDYADIENFKSEGVKPYFQDYIHPTYKQQYRTEFLPYMAAIDLIFNEGPNSLEILMSGNIAKDKIQ